METVREEEEVFSWSEVKLPSFKGVLPEAEVGVGGRGNNSQRRAGRDIIIAIDHGPNSKHAFYWALIHLCRIGDLIHLVHSVSSVKNEVIYQMSQVLMEKLALEAFKVAKVRTVARIVEGDAGKVICKEADRVKPAAVVLGTRGRSLIKSVLQGSVGQYCVHHCKSAPVIIVPGKEAGEESLIQ